MLTADLTKQKGLLNSKDKSIKNIQIKAQVEINEKKNRTEKKRHAKHCKNRAKIFHMCFTQLP